MFEGFMAVLKQSSQMSETSMAHKKSSDLMECDVKPFTKYIKLPLWQQCKPQIHIS